MVVSRRVARFNRAMFNPVVRPVLAWLPGFGVVRHRGRRSGRWYRTPVSVFRQGGEHVIALTYGSGADWVGNVTAAGGCELRTRGRVVRLVEPRIVRDPAMPDVPAVVRPVLRALRVSEALHLTVAPSDEG